MLSLFGNYISCLSILRSLPLLGFLWWFPHSSTGKESAYYAVHPSSIPESGISAGKGIGYPLPPVFLSFPCGSPGKESACNVGNLSSIPGLGRFPGEGKGYPLQYSDLENSKGVAKSRTRLSNFHFTYSDFLSFWLFFQLQKQDTYSGCKGPSHQRFLPPRFLQRGNVLIYTNYYDLAFCPLVAHSKKFYDSRSFPLYLVSLNYIVPIVSSLWSCF